MSESIKRKNSSKQLLQNLIRVTAQRSQEDAEEVEREQRRRAREVQRGEESPTRTDPPRHNQAGCSTEPEHNTEPEHSTGANEELKPSCRLVLDEDEGFSDWSHRLENRNVQQARDYCKARVQRPALPQKQQKPKPEEEKQPRRDEEEEECEPEPSCRFQKASTRPPEKMSSIRNEVRTSVSSAAFLPQDAGQRLPNRTSYMSPETTGPRGATCRLDREVEQAEQHKDEVQTALQREWRSAGTRQRPTDEDEDDDDDDDNDEEEELRFSQGEKEDLHLRREQRHVEEGQKEVPRMPYKSSVEGDRCEEVSRRSTVSVCSSEGDDQLNCYGPMSPTFKKLLVQFYPDEANSRVSTDGKCSIIERTESLRKSTSNIKKTLPPVPVSKIDKKLEQYTHALEVSSKEVRAGSQVLTDLTSQTEPVAAKKNLFEAREAWNQNIVSGSQSKDADGLKVGVADLINQWVRGGEDGSRSSSPSRPAENSSGKRYKFVVSGHGKYEKVSAHDSCSADTNFQSAGQFYEDL